MKINREKVQELHDLAKPLSDWLYKNGCPHDMVLIQQDRVELFSGEMASPFELRD